MTTSVLRPTSTKEQLNPSKIMWHFPAIFQCDPLVLISSRVVFFTTARGGFREATGIRRAPPRGAPCGVWNQPLGLPASRLKRSPIASLRRSLKGGGKTRKRAKTGKYCNLQHFRGPRGLKWAEMQELTIRALMLPTPPKGGGLSLKPTRVGAPRRSGTLPDNFVFALGALLGPLGAQFYASWMPSCLGSHFDTHLGPILDPPGTLKSFKNHWFFQ